MTRIEIMKRRKMGERVVLTVMEKKDSEREIKRNEEERKALDFRYYIGTTNHGMERMIT